MTPPVELAATLVAGLSRVHASVRTEIQGLTTEALAWHPGGETNSISTIAIHALESEAELLRIIAGLPAPRDRASEFSAPPERAQDLERRIESAELLLQELGPRIREADLVAEFERPSAVRNKEPRTGLFWLINGYGHAREHLAQIQLTRQMFATRQEGTGAV